MSLINLLTDITLEWWDTRRFWLGFSVGWMMSVVTFMINVTLIKLGVITL